MDFEFAPMEGVTGWLFRQTHHKLFPGVDRYFTPFLSPTQTRKLTPRMLRDVEPGHNGGIPTVPQLLTRNPGDFLWAAGELAAMGYREVNLNLGCPSGTVVSKGKGSGFLGHLQELEAFLDTVFATCPIGISIKTRLGLVEPEEFWPIVQLYNRYDLAGLTIHPRVQRDMYKNTPRMDVFEKALARSRHPVCYNGDLVTVEDCQAFAQGYPEVKTVMVGRGLVADPALVRKAKGGAPATRQELTAFHDTLYEGYCEDFASRQNAMQRMKEVWFYLVERFDDSDKRIKLVRKATDPLVYEAAASQLLKEAPLREASSLI